MQQKRDERTRMRQVTSRDLCPKVRTHPKDTVPRGFAGIALAFGMLAVLVTFLGSWCMHESWCSKGVCTVTTATITGSAGVSKKRNEWKSTDYIRSRTNPLSQNTAITIISIVLFPDFDLYWFPVKTRHSTAMHLHTSHEDIKLLRIPGNRIRPWCSKS